MAQSFSLLPYAAPDTRIRFISAGEPADGWLYVDNVRVDAVRQGIGGRLWDDLNRDGVQNAAEPGLRGVTVHLYNSTCAAATGPAYRTTVTGDDGHYAVTPLAAGVYCVRAETATLPFGYALTTAKATVDVSLAATQYYDAADFGYAVAAAADRLLVSAYAPCADAAWLQQIAQVYSATVTSHNPATCGYTVQTPPANQASLQAAIAADPHARRADPDAWAHAAYTPNDPDYSDPWLVYGPRRIHADAAWDVTRGDPAIIIAVLDSGLDLTHPEFAGRIRPGYDFVNSDSDPSDDQQHGTHVTGIAGAGINNGIGIAGIAGGASFLPVKVLNAKGGGWWSDIARGVTWAVDQGARVLNLSLAGTSYSQALYDAIAYANSKGAVVVAAAGNNGMSAPTYPAAFDHVLAVGASDYDDLRMAFSNYGINVDVMAPGDSIWSTYPANGYAYMSGTSMAAPHAAGVAALMLSVNPNLTSAQLRERLQATAADMGAPGRDDFTGYGLINAQAALAAITPAPFVTPTTSLAAALLTDLNGNGQVDPGDTLRYLVTVANGGAQPLNNVVVNAALPLYTSYVISGTRLSGIPVRDNAPPQTALPLDEGGLNIGAVPAQGSATVSFDVVVGQPPRGVYALVGQAIVQVEISSQAAVQGLADSQTLQVVTPLAGALLQAGVDQASAHAGETLTYSFITDYLGGSLLSSAVVTAAVPAGTSYVGGSASAGGTENGGMVTWNLGSNTTGIPRFTAGQPMAIALDRVSTGAASSGTSFSISHTTAGQARLMLVGVAVDLPGGARQATSVTYAGLPLTRLGFDQISPGSNGARVELWQLTNPPVGTADVIITFDNDLTHVTAGVATFTGVNQTTPTGPFFSNTVAATSVSLTVPSAAGELVYDAMDYNRRSDAYAPNSGQTQVWKLRQTDAAGGGSSKPGAATVAMGWTGDTSRNWAIGAVAIKPAFTPNLGNVLTAAPTLATSGSSITVTMALTQTGMMTTTDTINVRISASSNDAEEEGPEGANLGPGGMYLNSTDLEMTQDMEPAVSGTQKVGLRFTNIGVPKGATITNAYLAFRAVAPDGPNTNNGATSLTIRGQAADNPAAFTSTRWDITNRITTTASVAWAPAAWTTGADYSTPNLKTIVQEIVNRSGWVSGNSMVFLVTGTGSRSADSYDGSPSTAPLLHIEWESAPVPILPGPLTITATNGVTATWISGPTPISATVGISATTFTWVYRGTGTNIGQLTFGADAAGGGNTWLPAQSNSVIVHPPLTFGALVNSPATVSPVSAAGYFRDATAFPLSPSNTVQTTIEASIGDRVWTDLNGDGAQDVGEPGLNGVQVCATPLAGGTPGECATTDPQGVYRIFGLTNGVYYTVTVNLATVPADYLLTTPTSFVRTATTAGVADADFGLQALATIIGDYIWYDADADGRQDVGEPGLANITLALYRDDGDGVFEPGPGLGRDIYIGSTVSDAAGVYALRAIGAGTYFVDVTDDNGLLAGLNHTVGPQSLAEPSPPISVNMGDTYRAADFGYVRPASPGTAVIGDLVWLDGNRNGVREITEPVLIGVQICATPAGGGAPLCAVTDLGGRYLLPAPAGAYIIAPTAPPLGLTPSTTVPLTVSVVAGQQNLNADFGYSGDSAALGGTIWQDLPVDDVADGLYNPAVEPGIANVSVNVIRDADADGAWDAGEPILATFSGSTGDYLFDSLLPGAYLAQVSDTLAMLRRFAVSTLDPNPRQDFNNQRQPYSVTLSAGQTNTTADFGYRELDAFGQGDPPDPGVIGDLVWYDVKGDGVYTPAEGDQAIAGVTLALTQDGAPYATATTGGYGQYLFTDLPLGHPYAVRVTDAFGVLEGLLPSALGPNPGQDNQNQTQPYTVTLGLRRDNRTADFGYFRPVAFGDCVYFDVNRNGIQDAGEPGIAGVTLDVYRQGLKVASPATDAAGMYTVTAPAAAYTITIAPAEFAPGGTLYRWTPTYTPTMPITLTAGQVLTTTDFGFTIRSSYTVTQRLNTSDPVRPGVPISFTIRITNTGDTWLTALQLTYAFSATYLTYGFGGAFAVPDSDDHVNDGLLTWTDLLNGAFAARRPQALAGAGPLAPGASLAVTVTFTGRSDTHAIGGQGAPGMATIQNGYFDPDGPAGSLAPFAIPAVSSASADAYVRVFVPTGLTLVDFTAAANQSRVTLTWRTANEAQILGFNVFRRVSNGPLQPVNGELIPAEHAGANQGTTYTFTDKPATGAYAYLLEVIQLDGSRIRTNPTAVRVGP